MNIRRRFAAVVAVASSALLVATASPASASVEGPTWTHAAHQWPNVRIEDHTGASWPVHAGTIAWGSGLHYGPCVSNQCIKVYEKHMGKNGTIGYTSLAWTSDAVGRTHFAPLEIVFNADYAPMMSYSKRAQVVKHELGHALGLGHDAAEDVMNADGTHSYNVISKYERTELADLYIR